MWGLQLWLPWSLNSRRKILKETNAYQQASICERVSFCRRPVPSWKIRRHKSMAVKTRMYDVPSSCQLPVENTVWWFARYFSVSIGLAKWRRCCSGSQKGRLKRNRLESLYRFGSCSQPTLAWFGRTSRWRKLAKSTFKCANVSLTVIIGHFIHEDWFKTQVIDMVELNFSQAAKRKMQHAGQLK